MTRVRVAVVSDTHLPRFGHALPRELLRAWEREPPDVIVHLGDFTGPFVPALLERHARLEAVAGNNDGPQLTERFGRRRVVEVATVRFGLVHGDLGAGRSTPQRAAGAFAAGEVDAVLFGHSHIPLVERLDDGRWLINPGSPTDKRRQPRYSWASVEIEGREVRPRLHFFDDRRA